jgi:hypothetical protein
MTIKHKNKAETPKKQTLAKRLLKHTTIDKNSKITAEDLQRLVQHNEMYLYRNCEATSTVINQLVSDLLQFSMCDNDVRNISFFYKSRGINKREWLELQEKHPILKRAVDIAKSYVGSRRELKVFTGQYSNYAFRYLAQYIDEYHDQLLLESNLKKNETADNNIVIKMDKFPETELVPKLSPEEVASKASMKKDKK